jgi:hypothetical protein
MNEEPKSIWKKPLKLSGLFAGWLLLMLATMLTFSIIIWLTGDSFNKSTDLIELLTFGGVAATLLFCFCLFFQWVRCWKNFRRFLFGTACFATLVALFYAEEDWRGAHDWEHFKSDWAAKGEKFDFAAFVPPAVPDAVNFAMVPVFDTTRDLASRKWRDEHRNQHRSKSNDSEWDVKLVDPLDFSVDSENGAPDHGFGDWRRSKMCDLSAWQNYYRTLATKTNTYPVSPQPQSPAQDVLLALSPFDPVLEQLRQAAQRPESRFPLDYDDEDPAEILLPHLAPLKRCSEILEARSLAELANNQPDKALDDVKLGLRLAEAVRTEPVIITHLVRIAIVQLMLQPVWEGLAEHKWSDAQLVELDAALARLDFLADYKLSVRGERAMHIKVVDWLEQKRSRYWKLFNIMDSDTRNGMNNFGVTVEIYLMPKGWFYQNEIVIAQLDQQWILPAVDEAQQTIAPKMIALAQTNIDAALQPRAFDRFARLLVPALGNYAVKAAFGQSQANLARTTLALERYRLAKGGYPETLDALAPQFIAQVPHDVIGGQPLKYRREANGQFVLYSVGWNETDDGGVLVFKNGRKDTPESSMDTDQGDWVWKYPQR